MLSFWLGYHIESHLVIRATGSLTAPTIFGATYIVPIAAVAPTGVDTPRAMWSLGLSVVLYVVLLARVLWHCYRAPENKIT